MIEDEEDELAATSLATMHTEFSEGEVDDGVLLPTENCGVETRGCLPFAGCGGETRGRLPLAAPFLATMHTESTENEEDELATSSLATMHSEFTKN